MTNSVYNTAKYGDHQHFQVFGNCLFLVLPNWNRWSVIIVVWPTRHILHLQYNTQDPVRFGYLHKYMNCLDILVLTGGVIPYIGNHLWMKSFVNYLLCHSLLENFHDSGNLLYKKIPTETKKMQENIRECFQICKIHKLFFPWTVPNIW